MKVNEKKSLTYTKTSPVANITNSYAHTDKGKEVFNSTFPNENGHTCTDKTIPSDMKINKTLNVENIESKDVHKTSAGGVPIASDAHGSKKNISLSECTVHVSNVPKSTLLPNHDETALPGLPVSKRDNNDMEVIFNEISKDCSPQILDFLMSQKKALSNHPNGRRWNANIIRLYLTLWCRSPKCYADLRDSGFLI
ncbi:unnamed protein product [Mytilus coruscus]|uniref:Uncharacterized protein n=1 Tax=Mytilus coruscus TaxID=42192 RepID=A0A6J8ALT4_MYTCO|nr:unnamed protein product [Mytilus coruscus]